MRSRLRIIDEAVSRDLTTLETARVELGVEADTTQDETISRMIHEMSSAVASYCNREFGEETVEEKFWTDSYGERLDSVLLQRTPVTAVISIELDGRELGTGEFELDTKRGIVYFISGNYYCTWAFFRSLTITYTAGYALLDGLPEAIERATLILIKDSYNGLGRDPSMRSETIPGVHSYTLAGASSESTVATAVGALLAPFRRISI